MIQIISGLIWFWQIEHNGSWHWEMSEAADKSTYLYIGGPDEQNGQAWKLLKPGESYQTVVKEASFNMVNGMLCRLYLSIKVTRNGSLLAVDFPNETTMRKSFTHRRMIIGRSIWQLKSKIINR